MEINFLDEEFAPNTYAVYPELFKLDAHFEVYRVSHILLTESSI